MIVPKRHHLYLLFRILAGMIRPGPKRAVLSPKTAVCRALLAISCCLFALASPTGARPAAVEQNRPLRLLPAHDALGHGISGSGQAIKPFATTSKPMLTQVLTDAGAPAAGVDVIFRVEPSAAEDGSLERNGGLVPLIGGQLPVEGEQTPVTQNREAEPSFQLTVTSNAQGYAGAYFVAGRLTGGVPITAFIADQPDADLRFSVRVINPKWGFLLWSGLLGGLALFLLGMRMASRGLEQAAGHRLRAVLGRVTDNRLLGLSVGILVTALIQSSSATTVMVVSFTDAGLMNLGQTLAIILGADVGTTLTVQIIAFSLKEYSLLIVFIGFIVSSFPKRRYRATGRCLLGFGLIFFGMSVMGNAMDPLRDHPLFRQILLAGSEQPFLVFLVALVFTGLIQSSAATIGLALTFAFQGMIELQTAIPVIFGANIGTCVTAFLAALGTRREAQRVAYAHITFKVLTVIICWPFMGHLADLVRLTTGDLPRQIANAHTVFNIAAALVFLPMLGGAEKLIRRLVPDREDADTKAWSPKYLNERILETPVLALAQVTREISRMGDTALIMLKDGWQAFEKRDEALIARIVNLDDKVDALDTALRRYLMRLSRTEMAESQAAKVASFLYMVHHLESIGDLISKNLMEVARRVVERDLRFSEAGYGQVKEFYLHNIDLLEKALAAFATNDKAMAADVMRAKEDMSRLARDLHFHHLARLGSGIPESEETSDLHIHLISDLRRILSNTVSIAGAVVHDYRIPDLQPDLILRKRED